MSAAGLPVPGVVLGPYPERRPTEPRSDARQDRDRSDREFVPRVRLRERIPTIGAPGGSSRSR